jgi:hypothetical protein
MLLCFEKLFKKFICISLNSFFKIVAFISRKIKLQYNPITQVIGLPATFSEYDASKGFPLDPFSKNKKNGCYQNSSH